MIRDGKLYLSVSDGTTPLSRLVGDVLDGEVEKSLLAVIVSAAISLQMRVRDVAKEEVVFVSDYDLEEALWDAIDYKIRYYGRRRG